jgi:hypothetical protein
MLLGYYNVQFVVMLVPKGTDIPAVVNYGLLNYPPIRKITRSRKPETCTAPVPHERDQV